jgi:hypothetical protein
MDSLSFGIFEAGTIGGRLPVEHRFNLLLRDPQSAPGRSDSSRNCQYFGMLFRRIGRAKYLETLDCGTLVGRTDLLLWP